MSGLPQDCLQFSKTLLYWVQPQFRLFTPNGPSSFTVLPGDPLFTALGRSHPRFGTFAALQHELQLRSTEILFPLEPASTVLRTFPAQRTEPESPISVGPAWPHTHTIDVGRDDLHVRSSDTLIKLEAVTINGYLQWQTTDEKPSYYVVERVPTGDAFAGALVALGQREGDMFGLVMSPHSQTMGVHMIRLAEKHKNAIRKLKLELPLP